MTTEDATNILGILAGAHEGCLVCVEDQFLKFLGFFPEHLELAKELYAKNFGEPLTLENHGGLQGLDPLRS